jgi:uncharacterized glyoxalase superfamily protein PhnB
MSVKIDMIGIVVKDMAKALAFYRLLGLDIPEGAEKEGHVETHSHGYRIVWDTEEVVKSFNPDWIEPKGQRIGNAFKCDTPSEVDELYKKIVDAGYKGFKEPWDAFWGQRYALVEDPDGNHIDLFAQM